MDTPNARLIAKVKVQGLHDSFNYEFELPPTDETVILIAPNGYGKTALLTLLNDCMTLNLSKAAARPFEFLEIQFRNGEKWRFERKSKDPNISKKELASNFAHDRYADRYGRRTYRHRLPFWVDIVRFNPDGSILKDELPEIPFTERREIIRQIERTAPWILHSEELDLFDSPYQSKIRNSETFEKFFALLNSDEALRSLTSQTNTSFVWPSLDKFPTMFIETQRLIYQERSGEGKDGPTHAEEISRQSSTLTELLRRSYGEYAAASQALDRTFPNRLIEQAQSKREIDPKQLKLDLDRIEEKRAELTEVGILVDQTGPIASTDGDLLPEVLQALQIYVEDSKKKLSTYDEIYPKLEVFSDLIEKKLPAYPLDACIHLMCYALT